VGDQHELRPPGRASRQWLIAGLAISIAGGLLTLMFLFATVLAANPCGAMGDACDDYGTTPTAFFVLGGLTLVAMVAFIVGLVLVVKGFVRRD
jgi:hypothetical protein